MSTLDDIHEPKGIEVRRLEVTTRTGRRRRFSDEDKARIVEEALAPGAVVSAIARRHGLTPQQVFTWRRQASTSASSGPAFVPPVIDAPSAQTSYRGRGFQRPRGAKDGSGIIEVAIDGVRVRIGRGA